MRKLIGNIKAIDKDGNTHSFPAFQEYQMYSLFGKESWEPTYKELQTETGDPVNYDPNSGTCIIVITGERLSVVAVNIKD